MTGWRQGAPPGEDTGGGPGQDGRRRPRTLVIVTAVLVLLAAAGLAAKLVIRPGPACQSSFVPAFFPPAGWSRATVGGDNPSVIILNPASGPGTAPNPMVREAVQDARAKGSTVVGYIGTNYAAEPIAQVEDSVREYRQWYGVKGIFLDQTPTTGVGQIGYYQTLSGFIHHLSPGAPIWLNPGVYPDERYMSVGTVIMAFEGSYQTYLASRIPKWARRYPADRFANTIFATPRPGLAKAIRLSRARNAGYVYITDDVTPDPYSALPTYWSHEEPAVADNCASPAH
jgi:hypothetical protein